MSTTTTTAEQKKASLENRIHSHYKFYFKSNRQNQQSANAGPDMTGYTINSLLISERLGY